MKYILALAIIFSFHSVHSASATRDNLVIDRFHPMSLNRPVGPGNQGASRVYFTTLGAWGSTGCRQDSADIQVNDNHILSSLLMAFASGKTMTIEVDDSLNMAGSVCKITAAFINK